MYVSMTNQYWRRDMNGGKLEKARVVVDDTVKS